MRESAGTRARMRISGVHSADHGNGRRARPPDWPSQLGGCLMTVVPRGMALLASAALSLSLAAPSIASVASHGLPAWACSPEEIAAGAAGLGAEARGGAAADSNGRVREKDTGQIVSRPSEVRQGPGAGRLVTVPVYWHVVTDGARRRHRRPDPQPDQRDQPRFSGSDGGAASGFTFLARRCHAHEQPRLVRVTRCRPVPSTR